MVVADCRNGTHRHRGLVGCKEFGRLQLRSLRGRNKTVMMVNRIPCGALRHIGSKHDTYAVFLLMLLVFGVFIGVLRLPPTDPDQLRLLTSVSRASSPARFWVGDWGLGINAYRPIHSTLLWVSYRVFGVWALPDQLINLTLHFLNILILFKLIRKFQTSVLLAFLGASLAVVSIYTQSPATWISDRPSLIVSLCTLILLYRICGTKQMSFGVVLVMILSFIAISSKESGMVVPIVAAFAGWKRRAWSKAKIVIPCLAILLGYLLFRAYIFGSGTLRYTESGYLLGIWRYESLNALSLHVQVWCYLENSLKQIIAVFFPIFGGMGSLHIYLSRIRFAPILLSTAVLTVLSFGRWTEISRARRLALLVIIVNCLIHFAVFRYRNLYVAQFAFAFFVGTSPYLLTPYVHDDANKQRRKSLWIAVVVVLLVGSSWMVARECLSRAVRRQDRLDAMHLMGLQQTSPKIDRRITHEVLQRYPRRS